MFVSHCVLKILKLYVSQTKNLSQFLLFMVNISSYGLAYTLNSIVPLHDPPQYLKRVFRVHSDKFPSYSKKRKISHNYHSLSLIVTRCDLLLLVFIRYHQLSFVVRLVVTCCTTSSHSLLLAVIYCHSLFHSLSLVVSLVVTRCHSMYHLSVLL